MWIDRLLLNIYHYYCQTFSKVRLYLEPHKIGDGVGRDRYVWGMEAGFVGSENKIHGCEFQQVRGGRECIRAIWKPHS